MIENTFTKSAEEFYDTIRDIEKNEKFIKLRDKIWAEMDVYKAENPDMPILLLKAELYKKIAEGFTPTIFPECPFYFEMGIRNAIEYGGGTVKCITSWGVDNDVRYASTMFDYLIELSSNDTDSPTLGIAQGNVFDEGHHCVGYTYIFEKGISGIIHDVDEILKSENPGSEKYIFNTSVKYGLEAMITIAQRFKEEAEKKLALCPDDKESHYLKMIAETAARVPANPPETFYEGLATLIFVRAVIESIDGLAISTLGHVDRLLYPLYEKDINSGRITEEEALDLIEKWICIPDIKTKSKINSWADANSCIELGGCDSDGNPVYNKVTQLFISEIARLNLLNPKLNCRISKNSPDEYLELIAKTLIDGHNTIALLNDEVIIPALVSVGHELSDARHYVNGGCQETIVEGCEHSAGTMFYFNLPRILDLSLNESNVKGLSEKTTDNLPKVIETAETFEDFYNSFMENMKNILFYITATLNPFGKKWSEMHPCPVFSSTLKGCIENGIDYTAGGAKYNPSTLCAFGFATLSDSLFAIKKAVYDEKIITLSKLKKVLLSNWNGYEDLQSKFIKYYKFGHGIKEADEFAGRLFNDLNSYTMTLDNERNGKYVFSTFTFAAHMWGGSFVRATPDGRNSGDVLSQSIGPSRIQKIDSITEPINSLNALNMKESGGISVLDVMLPNNSNINPKLLASLFKSFAYSNCQCLQPNYVTVNDMIAARDNPDNYKNLMVRVCGLSVYFVNLDKNYQEDMIQRNMYSSC